MWTLIILALAALLWLFKLTLSPDAADQVLFSAEFLMRAPLGLSLLAGVLMLQRLLRHVLRGQQSSGGLSGAVGSTTSDLLQAVITIALYLVAGLLYLGWGLGLDVRSLLATSALLTVIIGLALQPTLGHLFAGVSIEIERPLRVGDYVKREEMEGKVISLSWRSVSLLTERGSRVVVPNSEFNSRLMEVIPVDQPFRHQVNFNLASDLPPAQVLRVAMQVLCSGLPGICTEPMPTVVVLGTDPLTGTLRYAARLYTLEFLTRSLVGSGFLERFWYALSREGLSQEVWWPTPKLSIRSRVGQQLELSAAEPLASRLQLPHATEPFGAAARDRAPKMPHTRPLTLAALKNLGPRLQDILLSSAQTLHYGPLERCDSNSVALVYQGRLVEERAMDARHAQTAVRALVAQIEYPSAVAAVQPLNRAVYKALLREATLALGPLAHDLCKRIALLTADPHVAYHAVASFISEPNQRSAFLAHVSVQPNRSLAEGDWLGWAHVLQIESDAPACRANDACALLVWSPAVLRAALDAASLEDLQALAHLLRAQAPGCESLSVLELQSWLEGGPREVLLEVQEVVT